MEKSKKNITSISKKRNKKASSTSKKRAPHSKRAKIKKQNLVLSVVLLLSLGVLLIFSSYAWFSTSLNVKIKTFSVIVSRNGGLFISFDAINYDTAIEISEDVLINKLRKTYPNNLSHWARTGLVPVSSNGISNRNSQFFDIYYNNGVFYRVRERERGHMTIRKYEERKITVSSGFIAFDVFLKNITGSPVADNLYLDYGTGVTLDTEKNEEMEGLVNSIRFGFVKIGSTTLETDPLTIQNLKCNNGCESVIFEPNSKIHVPLSIERAKKYNIDLIDGETFPTYASIDVGGPFYVEDTVSGSPNIDPNYFTLQRTFTEDDMNDPIFQIPHGITKLRVYVWLEGQDIDSLETDSHGASISLSINLVKDTLGYDLFN